MTFSRRDGAVYIKGFLAATTGDSEVPKRYPLALSLFWSQGFEDGSVFVNKIVPLMLSGKREVSDPMHPMVMGFIKSGITLAELELSEEETAEWNAGRAITLRTRSAIRKNRFSQNLFDYRLAIAMVKREIKQKTREGGAGRNS